MKDFLVDDINFSPDEDTKVSPNEICCSMKKSQSNSLDLQVPPYKKRRKNIIIESDEDDEIKTST